MNDDSFELAQAARLIRQRQISPRMPRPIRKLVNQVISRRGLAQTAVQAELVQAWNQVCPTETVSQTSVGPVRNGNFQVFVANSLVNQQLNFEKAKLLAALREQLPQAKLKGMVFKVTPIDRA